MAQTAGGVEFYLVEVTPKTEKVEEVLRGAVRPGDGVFWVDDNLYVALVADVRGSAQATRRLLSLTKGAGVGCQIRLVPEPFSEALEQVAGRVVAGEVAVRARTSGEKIRWKG